MTTTRVVTNETIRDPEDRYGWRVVIGGIFTMPCFNSKGAADAYRAQVISRARPAEFDARILDPGTPHPLAPEWCVCTWYLVGTPHKHDKVHTAPARSAAVLAALPIADDAPAPRIGVPPIPDLTEWLKEKAPVAESDHDRIIREMKEKASKKALADAGLDAPVGEPVKKERVKKPKKESRAARWSRIAGEAHALVEELKDLQSEFEAWRDNLPENLQGSAVGEKLNTICDLDLDSALETLDEAQGADVPLGFGRD